MTKILCIYLIALGFICYSHLESKTLYNKEEYQNKQTELAYRAKKEGDWLTLVSLARMAHKEKQDIYWEKGLIEWAKEIILFTKSIPGANHLAAYYKESEDWKNEIYWHDLALEWKEQNKRKS